MADTTTPNYGLTKPEIGASEDTWGTKLNTNMGLIDTQMKVSADASAASVQDSDIGVTVQGYDADTAKTDVVQTYTASQIGEVTGLTDAASIATNLALSLVSLVLYS